MPTRYPSRAKTMRACEDQRSGHKRADAPQVSRFVPAHRRYTPELIASGRVRYEQTTESVAAIAANFDVLPGSFRRMARRFKWVRHGTGPRQLPVAARLHAEAAALADSLQESAPASTETAEAFSHLSAIGRLEQAVLKELSTVEAMRKQLGALPMRGREAERTARTLSTLTETLNKLQRMRCASAGERQDDAGDGPEDLEAFRRELFRRIQALSAEPDEAQPAGDGLS